MAQETIKSFLVSLGYDVNSSQQRKFTDAIEGATLRAKLLGDAIEETARKIGASVGAAAEDFERLYYQSRNSKVAAGDLRDMGYAASQLGSSAASAAQNLEEMGQKLRENSGNAIYFRQFGLEFDKVTGKVVYNAKLAANGVGNMSEAVREQYRQLAGLSTDFAQAIYSDPYAFQRQIDRSAATRRAIGFDPEQAAEDAKQFNQVWRDTFNRIDDLGSKFFDDLMRDLTGPLTALDSFIEAHQVEISKALTQFSSGVGEVAQGVEKWIEGGGLERASTAVTTLADDVEDAVDAFGGWKPVLEGFFAIWATSKAIAAIETIGKLAGYLGTVARISQFMGGSIFGAIQAGSEAGNKEALQDPKVQAQIANSDARKSANTDKLGFWAGSWENLKESFGLGEPGGGQKLNVDGTPVSSSNPMPVTLGQKDQLDAEWQAKGGAAPHGSTSGAASAAPAPPTVPVDTRNFWERHAPTILGGKPQPEPAGAGGSAASRNTGDAMRIAMDQLRKEGVPDANLRAASALLVGQAQMESGLDPTKVHDQGTGYGIYGARLERRDRMFGWLQANGYAKDSLEGQMRYMAHEAMNDPAYSPTRKILEGATPDGIRGDSWRVTSNFEAPAITNDRTAATMGAFNKGPGAEAGPFAIGDSIAHRVQLAGGIPGAGVDGANPKDILANIGRLADGTLSGKKVVLSGGASNSVADTDLTAKEIEAIKAKGANAADIKLLGVGERADFQAAKVNDRLRQIAKDAGVAFEALGETDRDLVHPTIARAKQIAADLGRSAATSATVANGAGSIMSALKYPFIGPAMGAEPPAPSAKQSASPYGGLGGITPGAFGGGDGSFAAALRSHTLGGNADTSNDNSTTNHNNVNQKVDIHVDGSMDPEITARMVGANVNRVNADMTRNLLGVAQ